MVAMKLFLPLILIVFWNVENFFEERPYFSVKANAVAKTIYLIADEEGKLPDIVALAEVGNRKALERLIWRTALRKTDYKIIHYDSPDRRGIDCALLYRKSSFGKVRSRPCNLVDSAGHSLRSRDILLFEGEMEPAKTDICILVNHHPSKVGNNSSGRRIMAMDRMNGICDSLEIEGRSRILCVGDFNENLWGAFDQGTIKYNGAWDKIDGYFARGLEVEEKVFTPQFLFERDKSFGGVKPRRAWIGPRWNGGVSDHLPIILHAEPSQPKDLLPREKPEVDGCFL